jgi:hypothetical protein
LHILDGLKEERHVPECANHSLLLKESSFEGLFQVILECGEDEIGEQNEADQGEPRHLVRKFWQKQREGYVSSNINKYEL